MLLRVLVGLALFGWGGEVSARIGSDWIGYENEKFGVRLVYPQSIFKLEKSAEAGDGDLFVSRDGDAKLLVGALENTERHSLQSYQSFVRDQSYGEFKVTYRKQGHRWAVLSGEGNGKIFYEKIVFSCNGSLINSFALIYPADRQAMFNPIVERIEDSFRAGTRTCSEQGASRAPARTLPAAAIIQPPPRRNRSFARLADRIASERGRNVIVVLRRVGPPYDYKVVRGYAAPFR